MKVGQMALGVQPILEALKLDDGNTAPLIFISMRCFTNMLSKRTTRSMIRSHWFDVLSCTSGYLGHSNKNVRTGVANVLLGIATMFHDDGASATIDGVNECLRQLVTLITSSGCQERLVQQFYGSVVLRLVRCYTLRTKLIIRLLLRRDY